MPTLLLLKAPGGASGQRFPLSGGQQFYLGRDAEQCQVVVPNGSVSRRHAVITSNNGVFTIEDLGSRNGTYVNQARTEGPTRLTSEDRIKICDFLFQFLDESANRVRRDEMLDEGDDDIVSTVRVTANQSSAREFLDVAPTDRIRALLDISTRLSHTLELDTLVPEVADMLFRVFRQADRCFVILVDEHGRLTTKVAKSQRRLPEGSTGLQFSRTIVRRCMESLQSYLSEDAASDIAFGHGESVAEFRIRSVMCVPLVSGDGRPLGAIQLDAQDLAKKFRDDDLKLLTIVANIASVSIDKAQVHAKLLTREKERGEIEIARRVQSGFLPKVFPECDGYEFFAHYSPAQSVGGDYYDFIALSGGRTAVVLGDVAGKGVAAALLMAKLSAEVRFCLLTEPDLARAITLLSDQLIQGGIGDRFVTLTALVLDPCSHEVKIVNAGHINPSKITAAGTIGDAITDAQSGLPLGLVPGYPYESISLTFEPGENLLIYTDGVPDAESPMDARLGMAGVLEAVNVAVAAGQPRAAALGARLVRVVQTHAAGRAQSDDIALVCFGRIAEEGLPSTESALVEPLNLASPVTDRHPISRDRGGANS